MEITLKTLHDDVQNLSGRVQNLEGEVQSLKGDVRNLDGRVENLDGRVESLQNFVTEMKVSNTRWMVGLFIGGVVLFATIVGVYTGAVMVAMGS